MPTEDYNVEPIKNTGDPRTTKCDCRTSFILPKHPVRTAPNATPRTGAAASSDPPSARNAVSICELAGAQRIPDLNAPFL